MVYYNELFTKCHQIQHQFPKLTGWPNRHEQTNTTRSQSISIIFFSIFYQRYNKKTTDTTIKDNDRRRQRKRWGSCGPKPTSPLPGSPSLRRGTLAWTGQPSMLCDSWVTTNCLKHHNPAKETTTSRKRRRRQTDRQTRPGSPSLRRGTLDRKHLYAATFANSRSSVCKKVSWCAMPWVRQRTSPNQGDGRKSIEIKPFN